MKKIVMLAVVLALVGCGKKEAPKVEAPVVKEDKIKQLMLDGLKDRMKDPSSVQFRNVKVAHTGVHQVCGEINAKNSYGGYGGFQRFVIIHISADDPVKFYLENDHVDTFDKYLWPDSPCK